MLVARENDVVTVRGIQYYISNKTDAINMCLLRNEQWNDKIIDIITALVAKHQLKHFINVGCHIGTVALPISKIIQRVTAIEAFPKTYRVLAKNIELNGIQNIKPINVALGDCTGTVCFLDDQNQRLKNNIGGMAALTIDDIIDNRRSAHICNPNLQGPMQALDDMADVTEFDIMLVDIEGMEDKFLRGSTKKIQMYKPIIIIEIWDDRKRAEENMDTSRQDIITMILDMGYMLTMHMDDDFVFIPIKYTLGF